MYLVIGLGNPGSKYDKTRHNVGFNIVDLCEEKYKFSINRTKFKGVYGEANIDGEKVIFLKPQTYMNLSGESVKSIMDFYKISNENIIVIYDDISLDVGRIRIKTKGSAGGHNGIKNIIAHLGTDMFTRIKVGVGEPTCELVDYVLGRFTGEESVLIEKSFDISAESIKVIIAQGPNEAMNKFNSFKAEK